MSSSSPVMGEQDLLLYRDGSTNNRVYIVVKNPLDQSAPLEQLRTDIPDAGRLTIIDDSNNTVADCPFDESGGTGAPTSTLRKEGLGVYSFEFNTERFGQGSYLLEYSFQTGTQNNPRFIQRRQLARVAPLPYFFMLPHFRLIIDKSRKTVCAARNVGEPTTHLGYTDAMLSVYLDLGASMINAVPPATGITVGGMSPNSADEWILLQAATIVGLESQGIFSIDTDYPYSLGGNSLTFDHLSKIVQIQGLSTFSGFMDLLKAYKRKFMSKGSVLVQMQYSYSIGRFFSVVPSGFFSRFGLGVGPVGTASGAGV